MCRQILYQKITIIVKLYSKGGNIKRLLASADHEDGLTDKDGVYY